MLRQHALLWYARRLAEGAEGTSGGAVRIVVWSVIALGLLRLVGPSLYNAAQHTANCANAAASGLTSC